MREILLVTTDSEALTAGGTVVDMALAGIGFDGAPIAASTPQATLLQAAAAAAAVVVLPDVDPAVLGSKLRGTPTAVLVIAGPNPSSYQVFGMGGPTTGATNGTWRILTGAAGHPMVEDFIPGSTFPAFSSAAPNRWAPDAIGTPLAYHGTATDVARPTWFVAPADTPLVGGGFAAGVRIGLSGNDSAVAALTGDPARWLDALTASVLHVAVPDAAPVVTPPPALTITPPGAFVVGVARAIEGTGTPGAALAWSLPAGVTGTGLASVVPAGGTFTGTLTAAAVGQSDPVTVTATNAGGATSASIRLNVVPVGTPTSPVDYWDTNAGEPQAARTVIVCFAPDLWYDVFADELYDGDHEARFGDAPEPVPDTTAPTVPAGVTATAISPTRVAVNVGSSTDAVGVASYRLQRDGVTVPGAEELPPGTFLDTGLTPETEYLYTSSAVDAAGNRSDESAPETATTLAVPAPGARTAVLAVGDTSAMTVGDGHLADTLTAAGYDVTPMALSTVEEVPGATVTDILAAEPDLICWAATAPPPPDFAALRDCGVPLVVGQMNRASGLGLCGVVGTPPTNTSWTPFPDRIGHPLTAGYSMTIDLWASSASHRHTTNPVAGSEVVWMLGTNTTRVVGFVVPIGTTIGGTTTVTNGAPIAVLSLQDDATSTAWTTVTAELVTATVDAVAGLA